MSESTNDAQVAYVKKFARDLDPSAKQLVILHGEAPPVPEFPASLEIVGTLVAPAEFYAKRVEVGLFLKTECTLRVNRHSETIKLICDERNPNTKTSVTGLLKRNKDLEAFGINTLKRWTVGELAKFLRLQRFFFTDPTVCDKLLTSLNNFTAKWNIAVEKKDDMKGNYLESINRELTHQFDLSYSLTLPIFIGTQTASFKVDICVDSSNANVVFWMESLELREKEIAIRDSALDEQIAKFSEIVIIEEV